MTRKLYFAPGACSFVPHTLLETIGQPYEPVVVKLHRKEQEEAPFKAVNPRGQVPVLVDGDQTITQILAIVTYLDARHPEQGFLPRDPLERAKVLETLAWLNNTVHPTFTHYFMPYKFTDSPEGQALIKDYAARVYPGLMAELEAIARKAAAAGKSFLGGDRFGPLDAYALTVLRWGGFAKVDPTQFKTLWAHVQKVAELPAVKRAMERERLELNLYKG
jgi:glutathione S-transferase